MTGALRTPLAWLVLALACACARPGAGPAPVAATGARATFQKAADAPAPPPEAAHGRPWLVIETPQQATTLRSLVPLLEVSGWAGRGRVHHHDLVLALDVSNSAFDPTGRDVDGDGVVGEWCCPFRWSPAEWTTDWDDTIVGSEIAAARELVARLDPETTRIGLVRFAETAHPVVRVGPPDRVLRALDGIREADGGGTGIAHAIDVSLRLLALAPQGGDAKRRRAVIVLSDGVPTTPAPREVAARRALQAAEAARRARVRVHAIALGDEATRESDVFRRIAKTTEGSYVPVSDPAELPRLMPQISLTALSSVSIRNATTGATGEAVRVFPGGDFDGYLRLAPGENVVEVKAVLEDGREVAATRRVVYHRPELASQADVAAAEALRERMRLRTLETDLAQQAQQGGRKEVSVHAEPGEAAPSSEPGEAPPPQGAE